MARLYPSPARTVSTVFRLGYSYTPRHPVIEAAARETLTNLANRNATHVYDISFWSYYNAWTKGERRDLVWALVYLYYTVRTLSHAGDFLHSSIDKGPYNQSYMPGWGEAMGGRVLFQNDETKDVMVEENSHWQMSTGKKQMWHADCL